LSPEPGEPLINADESELTSCEVLVVGAGPAGGDLARCLARGGIDVVLVDQLADLSEAAFSSAALPLEALDRYGLPAEVVASRWSRWQLIGPDATQRTWCADGTLGVVLEFGALRQWLADQTRRWGGRVRPGLRALSCRQSGAGIHTLLRDRQGTRLEVRSRWVVDASGQARALLGDPPPGLPCRRDALVSGMGVEWLLQVPGDTWERWSDRLTFCLGSDWVRQGYGWIFPMQTGLLKLGACRLQDPSRSQPPLGTVLRSLQERLMAPQEIDRSVVLDRHGGLIRSTIARREPHRRGRLLGLGDAVSTANLLGGEGIRHALASSRCLAPLLLQAVAEERKGRDPLRTNASVDAYPARLRRVLGWRWSLSGRLARRTWLGLSGPQADRRLKGLLNGLQHKRAEDLSALLFDYRFERYGLKALRYLVGRS
jgi:flavin-dependent dehydrogenase